MNRSFNRALLASALLSAALMSPALAQQEATGAGLRQIEAKTVDFGASDAPLKDEDLAKKGLVQFPTVIGGVVPVINIKGLRPGQLKLSGQGSVFAVKFAPSGVRALAVGEAA